MATNPYSYGSLGQRWTVGEPTSKSLLDVSRVKADANRWALEQLIVDPDDTANFVLTAPGLNIDSNTLYVDSVYNSVGFRLTNPNDYAFNGTPSWVASGGAGNASVILVSGTTSIGYFAFADGTTGTDRYSGNIQYNHSTNTMSFNTNGGVEAMTINSAQDLAVDGDTLYIDASADRVGINTASPSALIHAIQGGEPPAEGMLILEANSSSRQLRIQPPTNADNGFFDARGGNMTFLDDGTEIFRYNASTFSTSSGINVGIGTSSAGEKLTVVGGNSTTSTANFTGGAAANDNSTLASDYGMFFQIDANNTVGGRIYNWRVGGKGYSDGTSLMTLTSAGLLGLGTSSPSALLHLYKSGSTQAGLIETDQSASVLNFKSTGQTAGQPQVGCSGSNLILNTNGSERARILSSGGITFNGETSINNALSDFEIGTWTPALIRQTSSNYTFSRQDGFYTKIGNIVHVQFAITVSAITTQGSRFFMVTGLPFAAKNSTLQYGGGSATDQSCISGEPCTSIGVSPNNQTIFLFATGNPTINSGVLGETGANTVTTIAGNFVGAITYEVE